VRTAFDIIRIMRSRRSGGSVE